MAKIEIKTDKPSGNGMSFGEKRHIFLMFVALVVLIGVMTNPECLNRSGTPQQTSQTPVDPKQKEEETAPDVTDNALGEVKGGVEMGETKLKKEKPPLLKSYEKGMVVGDPEIWANVKDDGSISMEALSQGVEVAMDIREDEIEKILAGDSIEKVFEENNIPQRGKFFSIRGTVEDMIGTYITLARNAARKLPLASFVYEGVITDEKTGKQIIVYGADICEEYIIKRQVDFEAVFIGMKKDWTKDELVPLFMFKTCRRVHIDPLAGVTEFTPGMKLGDPQVWDMAEDLMKDVIEKEPYYHALEILVDISQENLDACIDPELNFSRIFRKTLNPRQHRGKVYKLRGTVLRIEEKKASPNRDVTAKLPHSPFVFVGQVREEDSLKPFTFRALKIPENLKEGDFIEMSGIYVKVYTFPNRMGEGNFTRTPLIMGKKIIRFNRKSYIMESVSVISGIVFLFLFWAAVAERKRTRQFDQRMKELKERKRKRKEAGDEGNSKDSPEPVSGEEKAEAEESEEESSKEENSDTGESDSEGKDPE